MIWFRPLPLLSLLCAGAFFLLLLLGAWQWRRFEEKLAFALETPQLVRFEASLEGKAVFVYAVKEGVAGWRVFIPAVAEDEIVLADIAFAPGLKPPEAERWPLGEGAQGVWLRPRAASPFGAKPRPGAREFYNIDLPAMAAASGVGAAADRYLAASDGAALNPFAAQRSFAPERHLGYALTWWGLAGGLVLVYLALHHKAGRLRLGGR